MGADDELAALGHFQGAEGLGASADRLAAVGQDDRGHAGIDRRGHPGIEPQEGGGGAGGRGEGGIEPRFGVGSGGDEGGDEAKEQRRTECIRVFAVGSRRGPGGLQLGDETRQALPMQRP